MKAYDPAELTTAVPTSTGTYLDSTDWSSSFLPPTSSDAEPGQLGKAANYSFGPVDAPLTARAPVKQQQQLQQQQLPPPSLSQADNIRLAKSTKKKRINFPSSGLLCSSALSNPRFSIASLSESQPESSQPRSISSYTRFPAEKLFRQPQTTPARKPIVKEKRRASPLQTGMTTETSFEQSNPRKASKSKPLASEKSLLSTRPGSGYGPSFSNSSGYSAAPHLKGSSRSLGGFKRQPLRLLSVNPSTLNVKVHESTMQVLRLIDRPVACLATSGWKGYSRWVSEALGIDKMAFPLEDFPRSQGNTGFSIWGQPVNLEAASGTYAIVLHCDAFSDESPPAVVAVLSRLLLTLASVLLVHVEPIHRLPDILKNLSGGTRQPIAQTQKRGGNDSLPRMFWVLSIQSWSGDTEAEKVANLLFQRTGQTRTVEQVAYILSQSSFSAAGAAACSAQLFSDSVSCIKGCVLPARDSPSYSVQLQRSLQSLFQTVAETPKRDQHDRLMTGASFADLVASVAKATFSPPSPPRNINHSFSSLAKSMHSICEAGSQQSAPIQSATMSGNSDAAAKLYSPDDNERLLTWLNAQWLSFLQKKDHGFQTLLKNFEEENFLDEEVECETSTLLEKLAFLLETYIQNRGPNDESAMAANQLICTLRLVAPRLRFGEGRNRRHQEVVSNRLQSLELLSQRLANDKAVDSSRIDSLTKNVEAQASSLRGFDSRMNLVCDSVKRIENRVDELFSNQAKPTPSPEAPPQTPPPQPKSIQTRSQPHEPLTRANRLTSEFAVEKKSCLCFPLKKNTTNMRLDALMKGVIEINGKHDLVSDRADCALSDKLDALLITSTDLTESLIDRPIIKNNPQ